VHLVSLVFMLFSAINGELMWKNQPFDLWPLFYEILIILNDAAHFQAQALDADHHHILTDLDGVGSFGQFRAPQLTLELDLSARVMAIFAMPCEPIRVCSPVRSGHAGSERDADDEREAQSINKATTTTAAPKPAGTAARPAS